MGLKEKDTEYIAASYARFPVELVSGRGALLYSPEGKEYIDLTSGIGVNIFGVGDEAWVSAVTAQLTRLQHTSNLYYSEPDVQLAEALCHRTGQKKVFFCNSGAEANECAVKAARKYAADKGKPERYNVITLKNSFHGRTVTMLAANGQEVFHRDFKPLTPGFLYAEANDLEGLTAIAENNPCCAIMLEAVQGEGGVLPLDAEFMRGAEALCRKLDMLLICDEVQCGNGRTGMLYGYMHSNVKPDVITTAKGLGGGLPIGACMLGEKCEYVFTPGTHGSTFGGNPVCCAGALSVIERIDDALLSGVRRKAAIIKDILNGAPGVYGVSGLGLMVGITVKKPVKEIIYGAAENGVLVLAAKDKVRLLPPLTIADDVLVHGIEILKEEIAK